MSYEIPRAAKLLVPVQTKVVGSDEGRLLKVGKAVKVQRSPAEPGVFIIWVSKKEYAKIPALQLTETIQYTDGREQL